MMGQYAVDGLLLACVAYAVYRGYHKGLLNQVMWLCSFVVAYLVGAWLSDDLARLLGRYVQGERVCLALSFAILVLASLIVMHYVGRGVTKILNLTFVGLVNSVLGALANLLICLIAAATLQGLVLMMAPSAKRLWEDTVVLARLASVNEWLMDTEALDILKRTAEKLE